MADEKPDMAEQLTLLVNDQVSAWRFRNNCTLSAVGTQCERPQCQKSFYEEHFL